MYFLHFREEHIQRKMDGMVKEAKEKMAKKDKKGTYTAVENLLCCLIVLIIIAIIWWFL